MDKIRRKCQFYNDTHIKTFVIENSIGKTSITFEVHIQGPKRKYKPQVIVHLRQLEQ